MSTTTNKPLLEDSSVIACELSTTPNRKERRQRNGSSINFPRRECGVIDTLQPTYGFITCTDRGTGKYQDKRLFFHHTEYNCKFDDLKTGDNVEFQEDLKNSRPVAVGVVKVNNKENWCLLPIVQQGEVIAYTKPSANKRNNRKSSSEKSEEPIGSITYTVNSEHFFLSFFYEDVSDSQNLKVNDIVNFQVSQEIWTGSLRASSITRLPKVNRVKGVISSLKESFGFIEREDEVKEIYFNYAEYPDNPDKIVLGVELEFNVKHLRNGKEEAVNIKILPPGSVVFHDISTELCTGTILRSWDIKRVQTDPLSGQISYTDVNGTWIQLPFGERDQLGSYTLCPGDMVEFRLAQDRRDHLQRATEIKLSETTFAKENERREVGMVISLRDRNFGLILPDAMVPDGSNGGGVQQQEISFKPKEMIDFEKPIEKYQLVCYTPIKVHRQGPDGKARETMTAIRILRLPPSSLAGNFRNLQLLNEGDNLIGVVQQEVVSSAAAGDDRSSSTEEIGIIVYQNGSPGKPADAPPKKEVICYEAKDVRQGSGLPKKGDTVEFRILELRASQMRLAIDVNVKPVSVSPIKKVLASPRNREQVKPRAHTISAINTSSSALVAVAKREIAERPRCKGWVIVLKETFGFIESNDHRCDVYFNFNNLRVEDSSINLEDVVNQLTLTAEVDYVLRHYKRDAGKGRQSFSGPDTAMRTYAEDVRLLKKGSIPSDKIVKTCLTGKIIQLARQGNGEHSGQFHGVIEDEVTSQPYSYTLMSQLDLRTVFQINDQVKFDVAEYEAGERVINLTTLRAHEKARVVGLKDNYGFLDFEVVPNENENTGGSPDNEGSGEPSIGIDQSSRRRQLSQTGNQQQLFFHLSAVQEPTGGFLEIGDLVEFMVIFNAKSGRYSAVNIRRVDENGSKPPPTDTMPPIVSSAGPRPTRLKMKSVCEEANRPRLIHIRTPRGPDGSRGFVNIVSQRQQPQAVA